MNTDTKNKKADTHINDADDLSVGGFDAAPRAGEDTSAPTKSVLVDTENNPTAT